MAQKTSDKPLVRDFRKGGRPAKFAEPSRPVTMTLPERVLSMLEKLDGDRASAVVKAVETAVGRSAASGGGIVGEIPVASGESLLTVPENRFLRAVPWITLVETSPNRHLISLRGGIPVEKLEVTLVDILDDPRTASFPGEREALRSLLEKIRNPRRKHGVHTEEILVVASESAGAGRRSPE